MRHATAAAVERHVGQLGVGDQHVDARDHVVSVPLDEPGGRPFDHVDRGLVGCDVMTEPRRAEHQVVAQLVGTGELFVVVDADRLTG